MAPNYRKDYPVTIDPSGLPNFGPQPTPEDQGEIEVTLVKPDKELVKQLLDQMELNHGEDDEGDLFAPYEGFRVYFMFRGEQGELFSVRTYYDQGYPIDEKGAVLEAIDAWNRDALWPKVYTHTHDDGVVRLIAEAQMVVVNVVNLDFFISNMATYVQSSIQFDQWLREEHDLKTVDAPAPGAADGEGGADSDGE